MTDLIKNNHVSKEFRICQYCDSRFLPKANNQRFCGYECWHSFNKSSLRKHRKIYYDTILRERYGIRKRKDLNGFRNNLELRKRILELLGNKCKRCDFSDWRALQIDHVNGNGRTEWLRFSFNLYQYYKSILNKIQNGSNDYQCLCANCNWIKRHENHEWNRNIR